SAPSPRSSAAASSRASLPRAQSATRQPSRASSTAMPRPMPRLAPVTSAALPRNPRSIPDLPPTRLFDGLRPLAPSPTFPMAFGLWRGEGSTGSARFTRSSELAENRDPVRIHLGPHDAARDGGIAVGDAPGGVVGLGLEHDEAERLLVRGLGPAGQ